MYLHVGNRKNIRTQRIIAIFDADRTTISPITKEFLRRTEREGNMEIAVEEIPKSFVLYEEEGKQKVCFSQLSSNVLLERMETGE